MRTSTTQVITVAYAVKRRTTDSLPGAFSLGRWAWPVIGFVLDLAGKP